MQSQWELVGKRGNLEHLQAMASWEGVLGLHVPHGK